MRDVVSAVSDDAVLAFASASHAVSVVCTTPMRDVVSAVSDDAVLAFASASQAVSVVDADDAMPAW